MKKSILLIAALFSITLTVAQKPKSQNVVLITLDGMRWQDVFRGADSSLFKQQIHFKDPDVRNKYWSNDISERRKALMPFLWSVIANEGVLIGNRDKNSPMNVTNQMWFSYPGYNELLTGKADDEHINSNDAIYNPNTTVLEITNNHPSFKGKVAAFTSWDNFNCIINDKRSSILVSSGLKLANAPNLTEGEKILNKVVAALPSRDGSTRPDALTFYYGMEYIKKNKPRLVYFSFDETDHFAHSGEYAAYLNSAHATDAMLAELWSYLRTDPQYKGKTALIITVDHGRGMDAEGWKHHGKKTPDSDQIWMACIGAGIENLGEETNSKPVFQNQVAATIATLLNISFYTDAGKAINLKSKL